MVRAKFKVKSVTREYVNGPLIVKMEPEYDEKLPEDVRFSRATPMTAGDEKTAITMIVDNPLAADQFELDKFFYVDFSPVE